MKSVVKTFQILETLSIESMYPAELAKELNINKSTIHRFIMTLKDLGYIDISNDNLVRLSQSFINLGTRAQEQYQIHVIAQPYMEVLAKRFKESAYLATFDGMTVQYIDSVESSLAVRTVFDPGRRSPAYAVASGKLFLANLSEMELDDYLQQQNLKGHTKNTITDVECLKQELQQIKKNSISLDNEEYELGLKGFAAPVRDHSGKVIAALCIAGITSRITSIQKVNEIIESLIDYSRKISIQMGCQIFHSEVN
nr:IclR family transcriptional regulator [Lentibacillus halodurans]